MKKYVLMLLAVVALVSCDSSPTQVLGDFLISDADEVTLGANYYTEIKNSADYNLAPSTDPLAVYVAEMGNKIVVASANDTKFRQPDASIGFKYTFSLIDDTVVNAFATPGGYVYIYKGLIDKAVNEAEVATVIAHEVGHVVQKHFKSQYVERYTTTQISEMILGEGMLSNAVTFFAANSYSRSDEDEADSCAVVYSARANYNPWAFIGFFNTLKTITGSGDSGILEWFSTHPDTDDRIANVTSHLTRKYPTVLASDSTTYYTANFLTKTGR